LNGSLIQQANNRYTIEGAAVMDMTAGRDEATESIGTESIREKTSPDHPFAVQRDLGGP
jgi:ferritin-like protein